ncbi:MAG: CHAD domain-containing protein [Myxococcota bacterium]
MTKSSSPKQKAQPGPTFIVQSSLAEAVTPKLDSWLDDLDAAIPRVIGDTDSEAVHDLRVAMRRIRSLLRVVRPVFGKFYVKIIRDELKKVADATGALRDEEVLEETIAALSLGEAHRKALRPWAAQRAKREKALRESVVQMLKDGALDAPRTHLRALLRLPLPPGQDKEAHKFARKTVFVAHAQVEALRSAEVNDVMRMHDLRIAYKRLRYSVEALAPVLPPELRAWGQVATKFQKVLGNLHDHDVALDVVGEAKDLPDETRTAVLEAIRDKRAQYANQYLELVGFGLAPEASDDQDIPKKRKKKAKKQAKADAAADKAAADKAAADKAAADKAAKPAADPVADAQASAASAPRRSRSAAGAGTAARSAARSAARKAPATKAAKKAVKGGTRKRVPAKATRG